MKNSLLERIASLPGHNGMYFKNLVTGETIEYHSTDSFGPASVIKLPVFMHIARLMSRGDIDPNEIIRCRHEDKMGGCGALRAFTDEPDVSIATLCELMITISDNSATNLLINRIGIEELARVFQDMGLSVTKLHRVMFDSEAAARGIENEAAPREMGMLLEQVYRREFEDEETSAYIEEVLLKQQINHKIPGIIGASVSVAHKTGEDDGISNDVSIVYAPEPFVLCFMSNETFVPDFEAFMRQASYDLFVACGGSL